MRLPRRATSHMDVTHRCSSPRDDALGRASSARDPQFRLPPSNALLHERLAEAIKGSIADGTFRPGERLPTHRDLARGFKVAIGTVTRAIDALSRDGIVRGEIGRGTFVLPPAASAQPQTVIDLSLNTLPALVPAGAFEAAAQRAVRKSHELPSGGYGDPSGYPGHRAVLAAWVARNRRVPLSADDILIVIGGQHGIALAFSDLRPSTEAIAVEPATFSGAMAAARQADLRLVPIAVDEQGMRPDALAKALRKRDAKAIYTIPVAQSPIGLETGAERRREVLDVCRRYGARIVEDDVYGTFSSPGILTYKSLAPDLVYYVGSLSKSLSPLLRVGVLAPPPGRRAALVDRLRAEMWSAPPMTVALACELLEAGEGEGVAARLREEAAARLDLAREMLGGALSRYARPGPHIWLPMPLLQAERVARRASEQGIRLTPPSASVVDASMASGVRVCVLAPNDRATVAEGLRAIAAILAEPDRPFV